MIPDASAAPFPLRATPQITVQNQRSPKSRLASQPASRLAGWLASRLARLGSARLGSARLGSQAARQIQFLERKTTNPLLVCKAYSEFEKKWKTFGGFLLGGGVGVVGGTLGAGGVMGLGLGVTLGPEGT